MLIPKLRSYTFFSLQRRGLNSNKGIPMCEGKGMRTANQWSSNGRSLRTANTYLHDLSWTFQDYQTEYVWPGYQKTQLTVSDWVQRDLVVHRDPTPP